MRVLLVEDDSLLGDGLQAGLRQAGYTVDWVRDGRDALAALRTDPFTAVVLDLGLPGMDGVEVLRAMRGEGNGTPVLILTARDTVKDKVAGLDSGADDYLVKPFELPELLARIRALVRRRGGRPLPSLRIRDLELNAVEHTVTQNQMGVELSPKEFAILQELMENAGRVLSRTALESALYGWDEELASNAVEVYIHNLRKKLGAETIRTIRGVGYVFPKPE
jgi:DNA-binding response OmpR family regulator